MRKPWADFLALIGMLTVVCVGIYAEQQFFAWAETTVLGHVVLYWIGGEARAED